MKTGYLVTTAFCGAMACALTPLQAQALPETSAAAQSDGEIVVTAQRRSERLKDVPASVTAISGAALQAAGITGIQNIVQLSPGLTYHSTAPYAQPAIRGVGTIVTSAGNDPNVAIYVDGVYMPTQTANTFDLNDVSRIEVLKGPQGTLYGRNSTGGAILVTTEQPAFKPRLDMSASYGRFNEVRLNGFATAPLTDTLAASLSGSYHDDDGYVRDVTTNTRQARYKEWSVRSKLLFQPTSDVSFTLKGDYASKYDNTGYSIKVLNGNLDRTGLVGTVIIPSDPREIALTRVPYSDVKGGGVSLVGSIDMGFANLSTVSSWRKTKGYFVNDQDRTNLFANEITLGSRQRTIQQDVTLTSTGTGPFKWLGGINYYNDWATIDDFRSNGALLVNSRMRTNAISGFGEASYELVDGLVATGGVRYSTEKRRYNAASPATAITNSKRWDAWTPRFSLRYAVTPQTNVYATYSEGFKSGVYNTNAVAPVPVNPEHIKAYEVGAKYGSGGISFNTAAFYYDYSNIQLTAITGTGQPALLNANGTHIYGGEADLSWVVSPEFRLRINGAYTHARFVNFPNAQVTIPKPTGGNIQTLGDASGNRVPRVPDWTGGISGTYSIPLSSGRVDLDGSLYYNGKYYWEFANRLEQKAYVLANGSISWNSEDDRYKVTLWGRNLTNKLYSIYIADSPRADAVAYARPRTYGVSFAVHFQ
jgi:iron complex outermembrane receptor protein